MNILLIGSSGYLGSELFYFFKNKNNKIIRVSSKNGSDYNYNKIHQLKSFKNFDIVFVLSGLDESKSLNLKKAITVKKQILESLLKLSSSVKLKKVFYLSSVKVYSDKLIGQISENNKIFSNSIYSKAHLYAENYLIDNYKNINFTILRLSNVYGSLINSNKGNKYILNSLLNSISKKKKFIIKSKSDFYRDFICIDYFLYVIKFLIKKNPKLKILNLCRGKMYNILVIVDKLKRIHKKNFDKPYPIIHNINNTVDINKKFSTTKLENLKIKKLKYLKLSKYI